MNAELKSLYSQRSALNERIGDIEAAQRREERADRVGKTYVYRNGFNHRETWPLYTRVTEIDDDGFLRAFQFEVDSNGDIAIRPNALRLSLSGDYQEIPANEFDAAWRDVLAKLASIPATT